MAIVTTKEFRDMSLAELRAEHQRFAELHSRTTVASARESVSDVTAILATWINRREREAAGAEDRKFVDYDRSLNPIAAHG